MSDLQDIIAHNAHRAYEQGVTRERERWEAWLARIRTWTLDKSADYQEGALWQQQRITALAQNQICFSHKAGCKHGACHALSQLIELIEAEQN